MANHIERLGVHYCGKISEKNEWMFREQFADDIGIDAHIEHVDKDGNINQLIGMQIKSGESWFKEQKKKYIIFRAFNERQYNYWINNPLPCIIVLYNPVDNKCVWEELTDKTIKKTKNGEGNGYYIRIPIDQIFIDDITNQKLLSFKKMPENMINYYFLQSQLDFMKIISEGGKVTLHSEEWINKSSGRGSIKLIVDDYQNIQEYSYPYWFPYTSYVDVFLNLFPWASFSADEDYYDETDRELWRESNCFYDKEDDEWLVVGVTFDEFRKKLKPMRSINHSNEVAEYRLILSLNELGRSFLIINNYLSKNNVYTNTRPEKE